MQPEIRKKPVRPNAGLLLGTALALGLVFILIVVMYFVLSSFTPVLLGKCVAVVDINTELTVEGVPPSLFSAGYPGSEQLASTIESINKRDDVGAVVFVINSPGGSVVATREVYAAVKNIDKPKVAYLREVAASGAYYVASGTDYIVSDPDTLTGSIGVIATVTQMSGLLDKLGVNVTEIKSGAHKDIGSPFRNMTTEERSILQSVVDEVYDEFRSIILENRGNRLKRAMFDNVTDGRILSGRQAYAVGLVDALGDKKDAIKKAADMANISYTRVDDIRICPIQTTPMEGGLFGMEGMLRRLTATSSPASIEYK